MRERDHGAQRAEIDLHRLRIRRVGIGFGRCEVRRHAPRHIVPAHIVIRENAVLCARLDRHICNRQTVGHRKLCDALTREFKTPIERAVDADRPDERQNHVFAADVRRFFARQMHIDRLGHLEPRLARRHADREIGRADARREPIHRAVGAGMRVRTDGEHPGAHDPFLRQKDVLDADAPLLVVVQDVVLARKVTHDLRQL